jgi:hypothetical protein
MTRKNRRYVAIAAVLYLFIIWSAFRWGASQRLPEGSVFNRIERDGIKRLAAEKAQAAAAQQPLLGPTGESRLVAAGPAYVSARYDATHVVFVVTSDTESRFAASATSMSNAIRNAGIPTRLPAPVKLYAPLSGLQELYSPDSHSLHFFPKIVQQTAAGDTWNLDVSAETTIPVRIEQPVIVPMGCSLAIGFLASVPAEHAAAFAASSQEYFAVRRGPVEPADSPQDSHVGEMHAWKLSSPTAKEIELLLNQRMQKELRTIDARLMANASSSGETASSFPGGARPQAREWIHADQGLLRGEGHLDYDVHAYHLTPDGAPRLFVRARWTLADAQAFLMTAWLRADASLVLLSADAHWSTAMRDGTGGSVRETDLNFQSVLNEFDTDHDGWAELLMHSNDGDVSHIGLYLYTDLGLVPLKSDLRPERQAPESCLDP